MFQQGLQAAMCGTLPTLSASLHAQILNTLSPPILPLIIELVVFLDAVGFSGVGLVTYSVRRRNVGETTGVDDKQDGRGIVDSFYDRDRSRATLDL